MATVTVCSKLPFDFAAEHGGKKVIFRGAKALNPEDGKPFLTGGYGFTPGVDGEWFEAWKASVGDFAAVQNGTIFSAAPNKAEAEAAEISPEVQTGFEQKTEDELGVQVVPKED